MGLRSFAKRVVRKVSGGSTGPAPAAAASRPAAPAPAHASPPGLDELAADAESLATIECGAQELFERLGAGETVVLVDVRASAAGGIPGARHIPLVELPDRWQELSDANEIVCYCNDGTDGLQAAHILRDRGLFNATSMEGGLGAWKSVGGDVDAAG